MGKWENMINGNVQEFVEFYPPDLGFILNINRLCYEYKGIDE